MVFVERESTYGLCREREDLWSVQTQLSRKKHMMGVVQGSRSWPDYFRVQPHSLVYRVGCTISPGRAAKSKKKKSNSCRSK